MLKIDRVSKNFGGLQALSEIIIDVEALGIHGIIGPNGAGKTTLFNIITGMIPSDTGQVTIDGQVLPTGKPHLLVPMGIARTFQNIRLFKNLSVLENVLIGQHIHTQTPVLSILFKGKAAKESERKGREAAMAALEFVGLADKTEEIVKNLSYGQQRLIEFARAMAAEPKVLLLDEPAAGMNPTEKVHLVNLIGKLRERKYTIVLIEHDMKLVMNLCNKISVLDHGTKIAEGEPEFVRRQSQVIEAYLGKGAQHA